MYLCQSASCGVVESRAVLFMSLAQIPSRVVSIFRVFFWVCLTSVAESSLFAIGLLLNTLVRSLI